MVNLDEERISALQAENAELRRALSHAAAMLRGSPGADSAARGPGEGSTAGDARYRQIVESAVDFAILATDDEGRITHWNEAAETILGWSEGQVVGRSIATIFTSEDVESDVHLREMRLSLTLGKARDERWHMRADGTRFYATGQMTPLVDDEDRPIGFLKILRDRTGEEKDRRALEASQERLQFALDASALVGTWDWDIDGDAIHADARFAALFGVDADMAAAGVPFATYLRGIHPDDRDRIGASVAEAVELCGPFAEEFRTIDSTGAVHLVSARGRCLEASNGRGKRFPGALVDVTTERRREARQSALLKLGDGLFSLDGSRNPLAHALDILGETLAVDRAGYAEVDPAERHASIVSQWTRAGVEPLTGRYDLAPFGETLVDVLRSGQFVVDDVAEHVVTRSSARCWNALGVRSLVLVSIVEQGKVKVIFYLHSAEPRAWMSDDIAFVREILNRSWLFGQRRRAEANLIHAETRLRLAQEAADIGTFDYDALTGELIWDRRCRAAFGIFDDRPVTFETAFFPGLHPEDRERIREELERALDPSGGGAFDVVHRTIGREDAVLRWVRSSGQTVVENGVTVRFAGAVRDVTEEKEGEERQKLLTRELQHRVKNTLAMVNALANQTLRRAANAKEGLAAFSARLIALSHAHDILTQTSWTSAPIGAIVAESLATHQADGARRIAWSGPDVRLTAKQSLALALALHELATNAAKYGSLSNDEGKVDIAWKIVEGADHPNLRCEWRESGGPRVEAPASRGFGSRLIEQALAIEFGGRVEILYEPTGVVCVIDAPMTQDGGEAMVG